MYTLPFLILVCGFHKGEIQVLLTLQCHVPYSQIKLILAGGKKRNLFKKRIYCLTSSQYSKRTLMNVVSY